MGVQAGGCGFEGDFGCWVSVEMVGGTSGRSEVTGEGSSPASTVSLCASL